MARAARVAGGNDTWWEAVFPRKQGERKRERKDFTPKGESANGKV